MRSALAWDGHDVGEAIVFGLGAGLGFFYRHEPGASPSRRFNGRAPDLEGSFYRRAGVPIRWAGSWRPDLIRRALAGGRPVLAQTDIQPIPYYDDVHFIGHGVAIVGLEDDRVQVADIAATELSEMPLEAFRAAVARAHPPLLAPYRYGVAPRLKGVDVARLAPGAIRQTAAYMLAPPSPEEGLGAMEKLARELPTWTDLDDARWAARFGYQAIEKRGTGGGNFRLLYATFLRELAEYGYEIDAVSVLECTAGVWTQVGEALKLAAFAPDDRELATALGTAGDLVRDAHALESEAMEALAEQFAAEVEQGPAPPRQRAP